MTGQVTNSLPVWIHIGLAKTGTTSLQSGIFSKHSKIAYLGKNWNNDDARAPLAQLARAVPRKFDMPFVSRAFAALLKEQAEKPGKRVVLLSEEDFTTSRFIDPSICAGRLHSLFPEARILLVLREPISWLQSMYFFRLSVRFAETLEGFNSWLRAALDKPFLRSDIGQLQIGQIAKAYADFFGPNNIHIKFYEDFRENSDEFIRGICDAFSIGFAKAMKIHVVDGEERVSKRRVTVRQEKFFLSFQQVVQGRYKEYLSNAEPILYSLPSEKRIEALAPISCLDNQSPIETETQLRAFSRFLDKHASAFLSEGPAATAQIDDDLRRRISEIVRPELKYIAETLNSGARRYLNDGGLR